MSFVSFSSSVGMCLSLVLVCGCIARVKEDPDQEGLKISLFTVKDVDVVDAMQYLAYCAVPFGDNVYFNSIEEDDSVLYEIGVSNQAHIVANTRAVGKNISLTCTNMSVRSVAQLVASKCGMVYGYTNGVVQLRLKKE